VVELGCAFFIGEERSGLGEQRHCQQRLDVAPDGRPVVVRKELENRAGGRGAAGLALQACEQGSIDAVVRVRGRDFLQRRAKLFKAPLL
jgi:hypothetical protein